MELNNKLLQEFSDIFNLAERFSIRELIDFGNDSNVNLDTETIEIIKKNVKTTIIVKFDKEGFPISHIHYSEILKKDGDQQINKKRVD